MAGELNEQQSLLDKVHIVPFKFKHLPMLLEMLKDQNYPDLEDICMKTLPKIGYIAFLDNIPIAAGFLRRVEGNVVAQIDGLTSNPFFGSIIRHKGITLVINQLIDDAKELKLKGVYAFTLDADTLRRAESLGFRAVSHSTLALPF